MHTVSMGFSASLPGLSCPMILGRARWDSYERSVVARQQQHHLACLAALAWGQRKQDAQNRSVERCHAQVQQANAWASRAEQRANIMAAQVRFSAGATQWSCRPSLCHLQDHIKMDQDQHGPA